jgi:chromosome partitioning protein
LKVPNVSETPNASAQSQRGVKRARILTFANQKGGVGKTTTTINLGTALAAVGEQVLIIDLDPQGNATTGLGIEQNARIHSTYDVLSELATISDAIVETRVPRLHIVPSTMDLLGAELELATSERRTHKLHDAIEHHYNNSGSALPEERRYTYILLDCPPSLNLLTINAMTAADAVLVPMQCEFFALEGLGQLLTTVERIRSTLNERLRIHGVVLTMYDKRNSLANQVAQDVRDYLGDQVYETVIPRNVRVSEAPSYGKPALLYDSKCAGSMAYIRLASEVIKRERNMRAA